MKFNAHVRINFPHPPLSQTELLKEYGPVGCFVEATGDPRVDVIKKLTKDKGDVAPGTLRAHRNLRTPDARKAVLPVLPAGPITMGRPSTFLTPPGHRPLRRSGPVLVAIGS